MKRYSVILAALLICTALSADNKGLGFIKSLAIPGFSQVRSGHNYGYAMMASELATIGSIMYMNNESDALMDESYEYAIKYAHITPQDYDDEFFYNLARYESSGFDVNGYNAMIRQKAQEQFPYDPEAQQEYIDTYSYQDDRFWYWDSTDNRSHFNQLRNRSDDFQDYAKVTVGVLILNHIISGVDYLRLSAKDRKTQVSFRYKHRTPMMYVSVKL